MALTDRCRSSVKYRGVALTDRCRSSVKYRGVALTDRCRSSVKYLGVALTDSCRSIRNVNYSDVLLMNKCPYETGIPAIFSDTGHLLFSSVPRLIHFLISKRMIILRISLKESFPLNICDHTVSVKNEG